MTRKTTDLLCLLCVAVPVLLAAWLWPELPDPMPSHWNAAGDVDGTLPKFWGVAVTPLVAVGVWLLFRLIPLISPKGFRTDEFPDVLQVFLLASVAFTSLVGVLVILAAIGIDVRMNQVILAAMGLLFMVIGNFLGKVRKNFFIGIRTPWTLASDEVWGRTHRLAARLFVLGGAVMLVGGLLKLPPMWLVAVILLSAFYPVLYSFLLYRRLEGFRPDDD